MRANGPLTLGLFLLAGSIAPASAWVLDDEKVEIKDLPKVVLAAAQKAFPEAKVVEASRSKEDGEVVYSVGMKLDGKDVELAIDGDGNIDAVEREIPVDDLPKAVIRAAAKQFPGSKITEAAEVTAARNFVLYELEVKTGDKDPVEVVMAPNGALVATEDDDKPDDAKKDDSKKAKDRKADPKTKK